MSLLYRKESAATCAAMGPAAPDVARDKRGVCGITGDGMATPMTLLRNILGPSTYHFHPEQTIKTLHSIARGETPFTIIEKGKLQVFAGRLGISASSSASLPWAGLLTCNAGSR